MEGIYHLLKKKSEIPVGNLMDDKTSGMANGYETLEKSIPLIFSLACHSKFHLVWFQSLISIEFLQY